ncbi:MAG: deoxyribose-phosphate aldolase [Parachlamydiales bacterium]|nr:deoxyribose-phosphate aldolase [Parachlamydiales bacterium]
MDKIAKFIDHTLLKKDLKKEDIKKLCEEAIKYGFKGVCIYPEYLKIAKQYLNEKGPILISVVDFPTGDKSPDEKAIEAKKVKDDGAEEIDMVIDVLALKDKNYKKVFEGISKVVKAVSPIPVKVIIETCYLNYNEKVIAATLSKLAGAKFVKTSTGFAKSGATSQDVFLLKQVVGDDVEVKASGGIKNFEDANMMIQAGATRLGTSCSVKIISEK